MLCWLFYSVCVIITVYWVTMQINCTDLSGFQKKGKKWGSILLSILYFHAWIFRIKAIQPRFCPKICKKLLKKNDKSVTIILSMKDEG